MDLLDWSQSLPEWQRDALRRIALSTELTPGDTTAILAQLKVTHHIAIDGEHECFPLTADDLPADSNGIPATILVGIGPVRNVDRLAPDQELHFALKGITLIYGDNASGKSGYARVAKKLCHARVVDDLRGDVFAAAIQPLPEVRFRTKPDMSSQPVVQDWRDGDAHPESLSRVMVLDTVNAQVYVAGNSEITYLPREIEIIKRLGDACTAAAAACKEEIDSIERYCRGNPPAGFSIQTSAGKLVAKLVLATSLQNLPTETALRDAAAWEEANEIEHAALASELARNPSAIAAMYARTAATLIEIADEFTVINDAITDVATEAIRAAITVAKSTAEAAALSAQQRFSEEPIKGTGSSAWELMYKFARSFAAGSGAKAASETFAAGDLCPTCQSPLDVEAAERMQRFDAFMASAAAQAAQSAATTLSATVEALDALSIKTARDLDRVLAEYRDGGGSVQLADQIVAYALAALARRATLKVALESRDLPALDPLPACPVKDLREEANRFQTEADELSKQPVHDPVDVSRLADLTDAKKLSQELEQMLRRRAELEHRLRLQQCRAACDTTSVSHFATSRRRDLITPQLKRDIAAEIDILDMSHVPLRFDERSDHGRNLFEMNLATAHAVTKDRVMSESEQRALGIACFLAEVARIPGKHALIVDDPVTSLDQQRLRRVAERLVKEGAEGRQVVIFTHNLVFYKEVLSAAADLQVAVLQNYISKREGRAGIVRNDDVPWIAKKVTQRVEDLRTRLGDIPTNADRVSEAYRLIVKQYYSDLRDTWERVVEEMLLGAVVERFESTVKTQSLKSVMVTDEDYQIVFSAMKRVSEKVHDMAPGKNIPAPDATEIKRDFDSLDKYRLALRARKAEIENRRKLLEQPPRAEMA